MAALPLPTNTPHPAWQVAALERGERGRLDDAAPRERLRDALLVVLGAARQLAQDVVV